MIFLLFILWAAVPTNSQDDIMGPLVYLMEWKYSDIAKECEFLRNYGFGGIVVSPVTEHVESPPNEASHWYERYEVVSYEFKSRSGRSYDFVEMISTCRSQNFKVFVDVVLNNMAKTKRETLRGTGGTEVNPKEYNYREFNKKDGHFNDPCTIDLNDAKSIRDCQLEELADLKMDNTYVRRTQVSLLNLLLAFGINGFLVDKAKFMWPWELAVRQMRTRTISRNTIRPTMMFDVQVDGEDGPVKYNQYADLGLVTDYKYAVEVAKWIKTKENFIEIIKREKLFPDWIASENALVLLTSVYSYTDDDKTDVLRYNEDPVNFRLASAFMLAYNHGLPLVLSTYKMSKPYKNSGPPTNSAGDIISPGNDCKGGWNCEHRLPEIYAMAFFNRDCKGQDVAHQTPGPAEGQFAFARGNRGFVAFNLADTKWSQTFWSNLPEGDYCESLTGGIKKFQGSRCNPNAVRIKVDNRGSFKMDIPPRSVRAIHMWNKIRLVATPEDERRLGAKSLNGYFNWLWFSIMTSGMTEIIPSAAPPSTSEVPSSTQESTPA